MYDGSEEFYVVIKESGQRSEEEKQEENRRKIGKLEANGKTQKLFLGSAMNPLAVQSYDVYIYTLTESFKACPTPGLHLQGF